MLPRPYDHLTPIEMTEWYHQGLCYNCGDPFVRGHQCKQLFYLIITNDLDETPDNTTIDIADDAALLVALVIEQPQPGGRSSR